MRRLTGNCWLLGLRSCRDCLGLSLTVGSISARISPLVCNLEYHHTLPCIPLSGLQPVVRVVATVVPPFNRWRKWSSGRLLIWVAQGHTTSEDWSHVCLQSRRDVASTINSLKFLDWHYTLKYFLTYLVWFYHLISLLSVAHKLCSCAFQECHMLNINQENIVYQPM